MPFFPYKNNYNMPYGNFNSMNSNYSNYHNNEYENAINEMIQRNIKEEQKFIGVVFKENLYKDICRFTKNERNSFLFYEYLRGICNDEKSRKILKKISDDCIYFQNFYKEYCIKNFSKEVIFSESKIDETVSFNDGILWALEEECNAINELTDIIERENILTHFNIIIAKKGARVGYLCYLCNKFLLKF